MFIIVYSILFSTGYNINKYCIVTFEQWSEGPAGERAVAAELAERQLQKEERHSGEKQHGEVRHEECTAPVAVAHVGEAPYVPDTNGIAEARQQEVILPRPVASLWVLVDAEVLSPVADVI